MNTEDTMFTLRDDNVNEVGCEYFDSIEHKGEECAARSRAGLILKVPVMHTSAATPAHF